MKTLALAIITALATLTASAQSNTVALATTNPVPVIVPFNPPLTRLMQPADRAAYVKAGGSATASDVDIYRWWHRIVSNGVIYVQTANAISTVPNPLNAYGQWLRGLCIQAGAKAPFSKTQAVNALVVWYKATTNQQTINGLTLNFLQAEDTWRDLTAQGYDLNSLPPISMTVTQPVYTRFP